MRLCYLVYTNAWSNLRTCVTSLCKQMRARMRTLALKNLILTVLTPFSLIFSSNSPFNALFSSSYRSCLPSRVGVAPTVLLYGRVLIEETMGHIRAQAFSLLPICCWRPLLAPFWCSAWLRGGGILPIPSMCWLGDDGDSSWLSTDDRS